MIDIHTHILYDIDDGVRNVDESVEIIKKYYKNGIRHIVLTPHYVLNSEYDAKNNIKLKKIKELRSILKEENINVNLYVGNEVYINKDIINLLREGKIFTINNSRYLLIELPFINEDLDALNIIHDLILSGIIPIIAHPERYNYIQDDIEKLKEYKELGALIQVNNDSLYNKYGRSCNKTVKKILRCRLADFIATDIHHNSSKMYTSFKIRKKIENLTDKKYAKKIMIDNQVKVLKDEEI